MADEAGSAADASKRDVLINATRTSAASGEVVTLTGSGVFSLKEPTALFVRGYFLHKRADGSVVAYDTSRNLCCPPHVNTGDNQLFMGTRANPNGAVAQKVSMAADARAYKVDAARHFYDEYRSRIFRA